MKPFVYLLVLLFVLSLSSTLCAVEEFRGLYVDAYHPGFLNHEETTEMVAAAKAAKFNAIFVEVRKRGDAYYNSAIEPRAVGLHGITGPPDYDPLADVIQQAHAAGLEVHAWVVLYRASMTTDESLPATNVAKVHPEWLTALPDGTTTLDKNQTYLDPGLPAVQEYLVSVVKEIVTKYAVDGVQLENPGYPALSAGYNAASIASFNQETAKSGNPAEDDEAWSAWRQSQVTQLIAKIHEMIQAVKPAVKLSASVIAPDPTDAKKRILQEWDVWCQRGLVDFVVPMASASRGVMAKIANKASESAAGRHVYMGLGTYKLTAEETAKQIGGIRNSSAKGFALFSYDYLKVLEEGPEMTKFADLPPLMGESAGIPVMPWRSEGENE